MTMVLDHSSPRARGTKIKTLPGADNDLSQYQIVMKYQLHFTKYFGPAFAYGVTDVYDVDDKTIEAVARVRSAHQPIKGKTVSFQIDRDKFNVWRKNIKLYDFISVK